MTVIFIVFMLSIPVYLVGIATKNKSYTIVSAIIMAIIAANTGSPKYLFVDLIGIGLATYFAFIFISSNKGDLD